MANREEVIEFAKIGFAYGIIATAATVITSKGDVDKSLGLGLMAFAGMSAYYIATGYFRPNFVHDYENERFDENKQEPEVNPTEGI